MSKVQLWQPRRDVRRPGMESSAPVHSRMPTLTHYTMLIYSLLQPNHFTAGKEGLEVFT